jgi:hypothetical protein
MPKWFGIIFGVVFGLCGLIVIVLGRSSDAKGRDEASWPTASGRIESVDVRTVTERYQDDKGIYHDGQYPERVVRYRYAVGGRDLAGEQYERVDGKTSTGKALIPYAAGQAVTIHYKASNPEESFLELPDRSTGALVFTIMGGVFLLIGLLVPVLLRLLSRSPT